MTRRRGTLTAAVALEVGRAAYAMGGLLAPARLAGRELGGIPDHATVRVARILGARHLCQAVIVLLAGSPTAHLAGAVVDGLHAASMVPVSLAARRDRRYYVTSAAVAVALATLESQVARQLSST